MMEVVLLICLIIFISLMISGRPVKIEITHAVKQQPTPEKAEDEVPQEELDELKEPVGMDGVVSALHEIMGVNMEDE